VVTDIQFLRTRAAHEDSFSWWHFRSGQFFPQLFRC